jgi:hypothetical protein
MEGEMKGEGEGRDGLCVADTCRRAGWSCKFRS